MRQYTTDPTGDVALTAATQKTVLQITAPATDRGRVKKWGISFKGVDTTAVPVEVLLARQSTAGTGTSRTPQPSREGDVAAHFTAASNFTVEPTIGAILDRKLVSPANGILDLPAAWFSEFEIGPSGRLAILCNAPAGVSCQPILVHEE